MTSTCHMNCCIVQAPCRNRAAYLSRTRCRAGHSKDYVALIPNSLLIIPLTQALNLRAASAAQNNRQAVSAHQETHLDTHAPSTKGHDDLRQPAVVVHLLMLTSQESVKSLAPW